MPTGATTLEGSVAPTDDHAAPEIVEVPALVVVWTASEPERIGEVLLVDRPGPSFFGRDEEGASDAPDRARLVRQRPGDNTLAERVDNPFLSRVHLRLERRGEGILVEALGKRALRVGEHETTTAELAPGDVVEVKGLYLFYCTTRPVVLPTSAASTDFEFGREDACGIVGESVAAWTLRAHIAFSAGRNAHVLVTGESGSGKELVARAIHAQSQRAGRKLVSRNAATFPSGLIDAELFGNQANYPNAGMPERPGLIGEADRSSLFLDEIGELPQELQAHLLRVLDRGEYQRLGDAKVRTADVRFIAATNRPVDQLKHDLLARLALRIEAPGLNERREDVLLIARRILNEIASGDPGLGQRFFAKWNGRSGAPRMSSDFARALTLHEYTTHVRELGSILWHSLATSRGGFLELTDRCREMLSQGGPATPSQREVTADDIKRALAKHAGVKDRAWRELGLPSRHALHRLIKKFGISGADDPSEG